MFHKNCALTEDEIEKKARELLERLSDKEKVFLLSGNWHVIRDNIRYRRSYNPVPIESHGNRRLGIEPIKFSDGPRGVVMGKSTCFPVSMARAASFDRALERRIGEAIGIETRAAGGNYFGGVCVNLLVHPAGGRAQESYGEDPFLVGEMGSQLVRGVQKHNVMACTKHYAVNNIENMRFHVSVDCTERSLREVYLPHFKKCVDAGSASVMTAYNRFRGEQASESRHLITDILRDDWGFEGFTITDFFFALRDSKKAVEAGLDVEMPIPVHFGYELLEHLKKGEVSRDAIDQAVLRVLKTQLTFENTPDPMRYTKDLIACDRHRALAREAAEESTVLLKNEGAVLPLDKASVKRVLIAGHLADRENTGDHGSSRVYPPYVVTALDGIRQYLGSDAEVIHFDETQLEDAVRAAASADAVIIVAGNDFNDEGEYVLPDGDVDSLEYMAHGFINNGHKLIGRAMLMASAKSSVKMQSYTSDDGALGGDRKSLSLRPAEIEMIRRLGEVNRSTVVSLVCGSLIMTKEWEDSVPAIMYSWYAGMEGGTALARVLFGEVNPSGKLPFAVPTDEAQLHPFDSGAREAYYEFYHGYRRLDHNGQEPAYPFGFGLSYTSYAYSDARVVQTQDGLTVSVKVTNTGKREGREAVQVYVSVPDSAVERHVKKLCGFEKVTLKAGESKTVSIPVPWDELKYYDDASNGWILEKTTYRLGVGANSGDLLWEEINLW